MLRQMGHFSFCWSQRKMQAEWNWWEQESLKFLSSGSASTRHMAQWICPSGGVGCMWCLTHVALTTILGRGLLSNRYDSIRRILPSPLHSLHTTSVRLRLQLKTLR